MELRNRLAAVLAAAALGIGAGVGKSLDIVSRIVHHNMNIQRMVRKAADFLDETRPHRQIRHEMAIHDIDVQHPCPGSDDGFNLLAGA